VKAANPALASLVRLFLARSSTHPLRPDLARGLSNAEMAKRVFISEKTVRNHLTSIFNKLDVDSRAKAIVLARDGELVK